MASSVSDDDYDGDNDEIQNGENEVEVETETVVEYRSAEGKKAPKTVHISDQYDGDVDSSGDIQVCL